MPNPTLLTGVDDRTAIALKSIRLSLGSGPTRVEVLKDITLDFRRGKATAIVGPSGCGKSTLLMTLAGLERPDAGSVEIEGRAITAMGEDELAEFRGRKIGIVFQSFHLMPTMTALENVAVPLELAGRSDAFARAKAELAAVGLAERASHYPVQLSGGEQQRVALARALVGDPSILLADEPTGNLDENTGASIIDLLLGQRARRGCTLVMVTHDLSLAARCDDIVRLHSGTVESVVAAREAAAAS
ncbi:MAG: ABC transporter ATP-binding protein [Hyphomicrobiales bacterium]|nr:ABC transporter ATP-binding protein [Hyphomicrobiales bacterium]MCC2106695.1 ABC transporter ATP-binding protein [Hyphomicrobiales bacterium]